MTFTSEPPRFVKTAAIMIIGDEVLNGKITDTNSKYFAKKCFELGLELKQIVVVGDEEKDIVETIVNLARKYDFILTSGGIGPTHDDITYEAISKAFGVNLELDDYTVNRMKSLRNIKFDSFDEEARKAQLRMATLPTGPLAKYLYVCDDLWVPIVRVAGKVHILPGVPQLFEKLLDALISQTIFETSAFHRLYVLTKMKESRMAPYLTILQNKVDEKFKAGEIQSKIKIGSYPHMGVELNTVSIIGDSRDEEYLKELVIDIEKNVEGKQISKEEEEKLSENIDPVKL